MSLKMHENAYNRIWFFKNFPGEHAPGRPQQGSGFTQAFAVCTQVEWCLEISLQIESFR